MSASGPAGGSLGAAVGGGVSSVPSVASPSGGSSAAGVAGVGGSASALASSSAAAQSSSPVELRASLLCLARCAERCERWDDVCRFLKESIKLAPLIAQQHGSQPDAADLSDDERSLLQLAYKHVVQHQRAAWKAMRHVQSAQQQSAQQSAQQSQQPQPAGPAPAADPRFSSLSEDYKQQLEKELHLLCSELIHLLESVLLKCVHRPDSKCQYLRLAGDMYRYLAELVLARTGWTAAGCAGGYDKKAHECYAMAYKLANAALPPNHPTRLQAALNLAVALYDILRERKAACDIAKAAFDGAIAKLEELEESKYKDATLIMQLLRDNLTLWTQQSTQQQQQPPQQQA